MPGTRLSTLQALYTIHVQKNQLITALLQALYPCRLSLGPSPLNHSPVLLATCQPLALDYSYSIYFYSTSTLHHIICVSVPPSLTPDSKCITNSALFITITSTVPEILEARTLNLEDVVNVGILDEGGN